MVDLQQLPNQATTEYWYDFGDITTLFQDTAFMTPVTADAQDIRSMRNKGQGGNMDLTEGASAGGTIIYNTGGQGGFSHGSFNSGGTVPRYLELDGASTLDLKLGYSRAMITVFRNDDANSAGSIHQNGSTRYTHRIIADEARQGVEGGLHVTEAAPFMNGTYTGAWIMVHDGVAGTFQHQLSGGTGPVDDVEVASALAGIAVFLGSSSGGNDEMDGAISEAAFWQAPTIATIPTMERLRLFAEEKYDVTF